jgi:hypothetical protein
MPTYPSHFFSKLKRAFLSFTEYPVIVLGMKATILLLRLNFLWQMNLLAALLSANDDQITCS